MSSNLKESSGLGAALKRLRTRYRPPRRLRFTREGKYFVLVTFGVGVAAINTGNNLMYLVLGMLLALIIVSGIMSEISLRKLKVIRRLPTRAQASRSHLVEIEVLNTKKRFPSYAIEVEDLREGQPTDKRCFFLKISPDSTQVAAYRRKPKRRGRDRHTGFRVATRFPFGLFEKSLTVDLDGELIIYPEIEPIMLRNLTLGTSQGDQHLAARGVGDELHGLRPMRHGDDPRDIYWRKSTLDGEFVIKERAREQRPNAKLRLDDVRPTRASTEWDLEFETNIKSLASQTVALLKQGAVVELRTGSGAHVRASVETGSDPILRFLALVQPRSSSDIEDADSFDSVSDTSDPASSPPMMTVATEPL